MPRKYAWFTSKKIKLLLAIIVFLILIEFCADVIFLAVDGGAPNTDTGVLTINKTLERDADFVAAGITFLRERDWWQNDPALSSLRRSLECSQVNVPSNHEYLLTFRRADRGTILLENEYWAAIEFTENGTKLRYVLEEFDPSRIRSFEALDLTEKRIESVQALNLAELNGGKSFRESVDDKCHISVHLSSFKEDWEVDYMQINSFERFLCFNVNPTTGEVMQVTERGFNQCQLPPS
jgi:hypothetical protein